MRWLTLAVGLLLLFLLQTAGFMDVEARSWWAMAAYASINLLLQLTHRRIPKCWRDPVALLLFCSDALLLTALLRWNGGAHNPFAILFLILCSAAAMTLNRLSLFGAILFSLGCLWMVYGGIAFDNPFAAENRGYLAHLWGMWFATSTGVVISTLWLFRLRLANERMAHEHKASQQILAHLERIDSMGRLLASTAHQLNTPLGTLQLGISELADETTPLAPEERRQWYSDLQGAVDRILKILSSIKPGRETSSVDGARLVDFREYLGVLAQRWSAPRNCALVTEFTGQTLQVRQDILDELGPCLEAVWDNAHESCQNNQDVSLSFSADLGPVICLTTQDTGPGMDTTTAARALEPLFTTKKGGTGLGLYLTQQVARRYGGRVDLRSVPGQGTTVAIYLDRIRLSNT